MTELDTPLAPSAPLPTWRTRRLVGLVAWWSAWATLLLGQLHALSRFATEEGKADLELPLTGAWAEPAAHALQPLLDWGSPDLVYLTYGKIWAPALLAATVAAGLCYRMRRPSGFERGAWWVTLVGAAIGIVATCATYWLQWPGFTPLADVALAFVVPGLSLTLFGSTALAISLLRRRFTPRLAAWLLVVSVPFGFLITEVTSMGNMLLPYLFAFAVVGRTMAMDASYAERVRSQTA